MNRIKTYLGHVTKTTRTILLGLAVIFVSAGIAQAATTISTSILTNGTLGVTGVSTFGATASTTVSAAGVLTTPSLYALAGSIGATASTTISAAGVLTTPSLYALAGSIGATASTTVSAAGVLTTPSLYALAGSIGATASTTVSAAGNLSTQMASTTILSANSAYLGGSATTTISAAGLIATPGLQVGLTNGTAMTQIITGTCQLRGGAVANITLPSYSVTAIDCGGGANGATALPGVVVNDTVFVHFATTTPVGADGAYILGANASSTAGFITLDIANASSTAITLGSTATSSLQYLDIH